MLEGKKPTYTDAQRPRWVILFAVICPLLLAALLLTVFTVTVQADASLARPASMLPPPVPAEALAPSVAPHNQTEFSTNTIRGVASWYGLRFHGHITASGERYNMYAMTACDNTLPFGSRVRVVNLKNHRSVVVRINDRGNLLPGRVIDLSYAAASRLQILHSGLAPVKVEVLTLGHHYHGN